MNRITVVAVAAVVALASGVGLVRYVADADERAAAEAEPVTVLVAAVDVPDGTPFEEALAAGSITSSQTLRASLPAAAVTDTAALAGTVADGVLRAGQTVVEGAFVAPEALGRDAGPATFASDLPDGSVAVSFDASGSAAVPCPRHTGRASR